MYHQPSSHEGVCKICRELIDEVLLEPDNTVFRENLVFPVNRRIAEMEDGDDHEPEEIMKQKDRVKATMNNAEAFKGKPCYQEYLDKVAEAHHLLRHLQQKFERAKAEARKNRRMLVQSDYIRSCYGDAELIREFLFLLSAISITPERLKFVTLIVNAATGCISYSVTFEDPSDNILKRVDFSNVFVNCFKNMEENDAFHAYFSGRGLFPAFQLLNLGAVTVYPLLSDTTISRTEKNLRQQEKAKYGMRLSLASCARLELLKAKRFSVLQEAAKFSHGMNAIEFGETNFYASLSYAASYLHISMVEKEYGQPNYHKKRTRVYVPPPTLPKLPPPPPQLPPQPGLGEDEDVAMRSRSQSASSNDDMWEDHRMAELDSAVENKIHHRKQMLSLRNHNENEGHYKFVYEQEPAYHMPQINVRNGKFDDFLREWIRTDDLPLEQQIFHRRQLCKFFRPIFQSTVELDESLFNYASYNIFEF